MRKGFFLFSAFVKYYHIRKKQSEERPEDLRPQVIVQVNNYVVGTFPYKGSEQLTHSEDAIVSVINISGKNLYPLNIIKQGSEFRTGNHRHFNILMR